MNKVQNKFDTRKQNKFRNNEKTPQSFFIAPTDWRGDGIDHINVNHSAATNIGRFLSHDSLYPVINPKFGRFASVRSMWMWLRSEERDDRLRTLHGRPASILQRSLTPREVANFRCIILDTDYNKLKQYPDALEEFKNNTLPLDCYFFDTDSEIMIPRRRSTHRWLVEGWTEIRNALNEKREPDFTPWLDVPETGIYDFVFRNKAVLQGAERQQVQQPMQQPRRNQHNPNYRKPNHKPRESIIDLTQVNKSLSLEEIKKLPGDVRVIELERHVPISVMDSSTSNTPSKTSNGDYTAASRTVVDSNPVQEKKVDMKTTQEVKVNKPVTEDTSSTKELIAAATVAVNDIPVVARNSLQEAFMKATSK